jgi:hypothetical protein
MHSRSAQPARWALAALLVTVCGWAAAQDQGPRQITGPKPDSRTIIRLFADPELKNEHKSAKNVEAPKVKFPRPVLEEAPNGAVRTFVEVGGSTADVWLHPSEVKTGLKIDGSCIVAQRSTGPVGATRGANEGCAPSAGGGSKK